MHIARNFVFGLATVLLVACSGAPATEQATEGPSPLSADQAARWITFTTFRDGVAGLYSIHPDGTGLAALTHSDTAMTHPDWSPDGSQIAVSLRVDSSNYEIAILGADGELQDTLTDSANILDTEPDWSPDGTRLAFSSNIDAIAQDYRAGFDIYVMDRDGSNLTRLTHSLEWGLANITTGAEPRQWNNSPDWSPDGQLLAFQTNQDGNNEIYVMAADGSNPTNLTNNPANDRFPAWSPDGSQIAFISSRSGGDEVWLMNADGSGATQLTEAGGLSSYPSWSPDGSMIAFYAKAAAGSNPDLFLMRSDGSGLTQLTTDAEFDGYPAWDPRP